MLIRRPFIVSMAATCLWMLAASYAQAQSLIHDYELNGNYYDSLGGPALTSQGGALNATNYSFAANQGLSLGNWIAGSASDGNYSIETVFQLTSTSGYRKLIDFKNLGSDNGLYNLSNALNFYPVATGSANTIPANTYVDLTLTRNGTTNVVAGYINGVQQFSFTDSSNLAVFDQANNVIQFFHDDAVTGHHEASGGTVDRIRIYDGALSATQVASLYNAVPELSSVLGFGSFALLGGMGLLRRRRGQQAG